MQIQDLEGTTAEEGEGKAKHSVTWSLGCLGQSWGVLTTVGFVGVITTVIHPITLPDQTDAHSVLTLEAELITHLVELGVSG